MEKRMSELEQCAKDFNAAADRIEAAQSTHQKEMKDWLDSMEQSFQSFKSDVNTELYGEKGPSGKEGVKAIAHDNKKRLNAIESFGSSSRKSIVSLVIQVIAALAPFIAGLVLWLLLKGNAPS